MYQRHHQYHSNRQRPQCIIESTRFKMMRLGKKLIKSKNFFLLILFVTFLHFFFNYFLYEDPNHDMLECYSTRKGNAKQLDDSDQLVKYADIHKGILGSSDVNRKIVFSGEIKEGYGNRLYTFLSSLLIALLTDSALIVNWRGIEKYIEPPIDILYVKNAHGCSKSSKETPFEMKAQYAWKSHKDINSIIKTEIPVNHNKFLYKSFDALYMEIACNPNYYEKIRSYNLASEATLDDALHNLNGKTSSEAEKRAACFKVGFEVGGNLLNRIWTPNKLISDIVNAFVETKFKDNFVIGIQMRYHYLMDGELFTYRFINCALQIENDYLMRGNFSLKSKNVKWFIASDSEKYLKKLTNLYPDKILTASGPISHIQNPDGYQRAIIDVELLSKCDEILMTGGSTFAFMGAMKSLRLPYNIDGQQVLLNPNHSNKLFEIFYSVLNTIDPPPIEKCYRASMDKPPLRPDGISVF